MTLDDKIALTINITRTIWTGTMIATAVAMAFLLHPVFLLLMFIIAPASYYTFLIVAAYILARRVSSEEVMEQQRLDIERRGGSTDVATVEDLEAAGYSVGTITAVSENIIGRIGDTDINEWVEVQMKDSIKRYTFDRVAAKDKAGNTILSDEDNAVTINGLVFKAST